SSHPIFAGVDHLANGVGQEILLVEPRNPYAQLLVKEPPPFTDLPPVGTFAAYDQPTNLYIYKVNALDADGDTLTYAIVNGPAGMTINQTTGLVSWDIGQNPTGQYPVTVRVEDGRGGFDEQSFRIDVQPQPGNRPPVITSEPVTVARKTNNLLVNG